MIPLSSFICCIAIIVYMINLNKLQNTRLKEKLTAAVSYQELLLGEQISAGHDKYNERGG